MDETLPDTLHMTTIYLMILLTSLAIVASGIPVYVCMIGALFISFFMMQVRGRGGWLSTRADVQSSMGKSAGGGSANRVGCIRICRHPRPAKG
jgi:hypothetical protein